MFCECLTFIESGGGSNDCIAPRVGKFAGRIELKFLNSRHWDIKNPFKDMIVSDQAKLLAQNLFEVPDLGTRFDVKLDGLASARGQYNL
jgi:hypothetical protein